MIVQRRVSYVHIVHAGVDERHRLKQWRQGPVFVDGRQVFAERPSPRGVGGYQSPDSLGVLPGNSDRRAH